MPSSPPPPETRAQQPSSRTTESRAAPEPVKTTPAPIPVAPPVATASPPPSSANERPKPPPGAIPFKRHGDFVVAFGDVLIGKPTSPDFPETGWVPAPEIKKWNGKEIAFALHQDLRDTDRVLRVIEYFNNNTPVKFVPLTDQKDSIVFAPSDVPLCLSFVGQIGGHQPIFLDARCSEREVTHEIMHALGFVHEHSRPDRDQFVRVNWQNIEIDKQPQFEIVPEVFAKPYEGRPFDYTSSTIYNETDFGRMRGDITLEALGDQKIAPVTIGISAEDLERLKIMYR